MTCLLVPVHGGAILSLKANRSGTVLTSLVSGAWCAGIAGDGARGGAALPTAADGAHLQCYDLTLRGHQARPLAPWAPSFTDAIIATSHGTCRVAGRGLDNGMKHDSLLYAILGKLLSWAVQARVNAPPA